MTAINHILTGNNVTVFLPGKAPRTVYKSHQFFDRIVQAVRDGAVDVLNSLLNVKEAVAASSNGAIEVRNGVLYYKGEVINGALASRIMEMLKDKLDVTPLLKFYDNLALNPSRVAVQELYLFLSKCNLPITADGYFLTYKKIRNDYMDIYSGTISNKVGERPSFKRNEVDDDRRNLCSNGLHVCSPTYLPNFGVSSGNRVVVCKVNPKDVVAVPADYNDAKMRVCEYLVVDEIEHDEAGRMIKGIKDGYTDAYADEEFEEFEEEFEDENEEEFEDVIDVYNDTLSGNGFAVVAPVLPVVNNVTVNTSGGVLSDGTVRSIRANLRKNVPLAQIARDHGTSARTVARIRDGETYTNVK